MTTLISGAMRDLRPGADCNAGQPFRPEQRISSRGRRVPSLTRGYRTVTFHFKRLSSCTPSAFTRAKPRHMREDKYADHGNGLPMRFGFMQGVFKQLPMTLAIDHVGETDLNDGGR